jgi:hypothetical protein
VKNLTIRGVDEALERALKETAAEESRSVNQLVLDTLRERFRLGKTPRHGRRYHDLDDLFGRWGQQEYDRIQRAVDEQRALDPELWS